MQSSANIRQVVPFFEITDMAASLRYYVEGLGFEMTHHWIPRDTIEWCALKRGGASLMLQEYRRDGGGQLPPSKPGVGVSLCFICEDALALYDEFTAKGIAVEEPFVGNNMWVITLHDPDGYILNFESDTDVPEETRYSEWKQQQ
ncbi:VOC family protein [Chitinophaga agrisoli]|uniref:VOC family protein n=1 Tax=Chitinophaga agrisoli TaxID=2607653 RepID=A0A5B2W4G8_9BACT|nr:VOC family protein [Chitinophaga agrisoli]KAA2245446.1 VOC family protein [Chitinophaga agrisoli]